MSHVWSIFYSGIPPLADAFLYVVLERRADAINMVVIIGTIIGCTLAILSNDAKMMLLKDSIVTAVFAFGFLGSLLFKENMIWWYVSSYLSSRYNRAFNGVAPEDKEKLDRQWETPEIRNASILLRSL
jgi:hypothetical protein